MYRSIMSNGLRTCGLLGILACGGCHRPPQQVGQAGLQTEASRYSRAHYYWDGDSLNRAGSRYVQQVAISDFGVEFVVGRMENPGRNQAVVSPPPMIAAELTGAPRRNTEYGEALQQQVANMLCSIFTEEANKDNIRVVNAARVRDAGALRGLDTRLIETSSMVKQLNRLGSDTGRVLSTTTIPAAGYELIPASAGNIRDIQTHLLQELGVDAVLRVRLRIGVYKGLATIEKGSTIDFVTANGHGRLKVTRSMVGSRPVIDPAQFKLVQGKTYNVKAEPYTQELRAIAAPMLSMAWML